MMKFNIGRLLPAALLLLTAVAPVCAQGVEEASATETPWSGWWWPAKVNHLVLGYRGEPGALFKHDQVSGKQSAAWEQGTYYHSSPNGADWWGHCHAWAAASLLEKEPRHDVYYGSQVFHVGEMKGLLSEAHYSDRAQFWGRRNNGNPGDDLQDMSPLLVWQVLRSQINQKKTGVVFDLNPGPQVWSYPAYRYHLAYQPVGGNTYQGQLTVWLANFQVHPDVLGTVPEQKNYTFTFQANGNQLVYGTDRWTGASVNDHPDFAWYPTLRAQDNPQVDYNLVNQLNLQAR
jgi:hypothetical protein